LAAQVGQPLRGDRPAGPGYNLLRNELFLVLVVLVLVLVFVLMLEIASTA
jgi:hypothetical protein